MAATTRSRSEPISSGLPSVSAGRADRFRWQRACRGGHGEASRSRAVSARSRSPFWRAPSRRACARRQLARQAFLVDAGEEAVGSRQRAVGGEQRAADFGQRRLLGLRRVRQHPPHVPRRLRECLRLRPRRRSRLRRSALSARSGGNSARSSGATSWKIGSGRGSPAEYVEAEFPQVGTVGDEVARGLGEQDLGHRARPCRSELCDGRRVPDAPPSAAGSPVCRPIRTSTRTSSGQAWACESALGRDGGRDTVLRPLEGRKELVSARQSTS